MSLTELDALFGKENPSTFAKQYIDPELPEPVPKAAPRTATPKEDTEEKIGRTVFIGNLLNSMLKRDLKKLLEPYGTVVSIRFRNVELDGEVKLRRKLAIAKGKLKADGLCSAYVVMSTPEDAKAVLALNSTVVNGKHIRVDMALKPNEHKEIAPAVNKRTAFVGHLSYDTTEEQLREIFASCGDIEYIRIPFDRMKGRSKGIAYVVFTRKAALQYALKFNKAMLNDHEISVKPSRPPKPEDANAKGPGHKRFNERRPNEKHTYEGRLSRPKDGNKEIKKYLKKVQKKKTTGK